MPGALIQELDSRVGVGFGVVALLLPDFPRLWAA